MTRLHVLAALSLLPSASHAFQASSSTAAATQQRGRRPGTSHIVSSRGRRASGAIHVSGDGGTCSPRVLLRSRSDANDGSGDSESPRPSSLPTTTTTTKSSRSQSARVRPSPVCWTSRRGMIASAAASATTAAVAPFLLRASGALAEDSTTFAAADDDENSSSPSSSGGDGSGKPPGLSVASPDPAFRRAHKILSAEADRAASCVTDAHRSEYRLTGVTKVSNVISRRWIEALRDGCELAQDEAGPYAEYLERPTDAGIFFTDLEMARRLPLFAAFSLYGPAAAVAGSVMDSDSVRYLYDQLFVKEEGVTKTTPWHQDGGYWRVKGEQVASVFVPLDDVCPNQGLEFVRGSHRWPLHNPQHFADGTPYVGTSLPPMPDVDAMKDAGEVSMSTFSLRPGDVLVFNAKTVHGGEGNWGRALSTRWVGDDGRFWDRPGEGAIPTGDVGLEDGASLAGNAVAFPEAWSGKAKAVGRA